MGTFKVSVVIPIYNVASYLEQCIESILKQTCQSMQIILVDDGSSDDSANICDRYAQTDERIVVIHQKNKGLVAARKAGLSKATGNYIGFVDGDDFVEPDMFRDMVENLVVTEADFIHTGYFVGGHENITFDTEILELGDDREEIIRKLILSNKSDISQHIWCKLFRAELIKKCYAKVPDNASYGEDLLNFCVCLLEAKKIFMFGHSYYHYRVRERSLSHSSEMKAVKDEVVLYQGLMAVLKEYGYAVRLEKELDRFLYSHMLLALKRIDRDGFQITQYFYPDIEALDGRRILLYGAGGVGKDYYSQLSRYAGCVIAAWVDRNADECQNKYRKVEGLERLNKGDYDCIILAIKSKKIALEVEEQLVQSGIDSKKIFWKIPSDIIEEEPNE